MTWIRHSQVGSPTHRCQPSMKYDKCALRTKGELQLFAGEGSGRTWGRKQNVKLAKLANANRSLTRNLGAPRAQCVAWVLPGTGKWIVVSSDPSWLQVTDTCVYPTSLLDHQTRWSSFCQLPRPVCPLWVLLGLVTVSSLHQTCRGLCLPNTL